MKISYDGKNGILTVAPEGKEERADLYRAISCGAMFISNKTCEDNMGRWILDEIEEKMKKESKECREVLKEWWG